MDERIFTFKDDDWVVPELRDFFAFPATRQKVAEIAALHKLPEAELEKVYRVLHDVVRGRVEVDDMTGSLIDDVGLSYDAALDLHGDLATELFPSVENLLEEQAAIYKEMHPEDFLPPPPPEVDVTEEVAQDVVQKSGLAPADPVLKRRLESIVLSRMKDVRDEVEAKAMLEKPSKTGGMGFTPEQAAALMLLVTESATKVAEAKDAVEKKKAEHGQLVKQLGETKERRAQELAARLKIVTPQAPPDLPVAPEPEMTKSDLGLDTVKDQAEQKKLEEEQPRRIVKEEVAEAASAMDVASDKIIASSGIALPDDDIRRRFKTLLTLFFRDLRDALETKSKFTMPVSSGGMGMSEADAERVMALLKETGKGFSDAMTGRAAEEKAKYVAEQATKHLDAQAATERKEQETLDRQYKGLLEKTGVPVPADAIKPAPAALPKIVPVTSGAPAPSVAVPPPPVAPPVAAPGAQVQQPPVPPPIAPVMPPAAPPAMAMPVAPPPLGGASKPTMADVKFVPKLTGPIDELRQLTLKDFRRLSKEPREATLKIKDKIDLLEDQGFEQKTLAVKAWQESEVNKLYLDILRKSLEGNPVTEIIAERELAAQPNLNKAEFDAVMELNRRLRFG
jgi:hypothetical protein